MKETIKVLGDGLEIHLSQSKVRPEATNVTIFGESENAVQGVIFSLADEWSFTEFLHPVRCPTGWGAMGRVWGARLGAPSIVGG